MGRKDGKERRMGRMGSGEASVFGAVDHGTSSGGGARAGRLPASRRTAAVIWGGKAPRLLPQLAA